MLKLFSGKQNKKNNKKDNAKGQALSNGEDEVNQLTVGVSDVPKEKAPPLPLSDPPVSKNVDLLVLERLKQLELQEKERNKELHTQKPKATPSRAIQPRSKSSSKITPEALGLLEEVGMTHTTAKKVFYLARLICTQEDVYRDIKMYVENGQEHEYGMTVKNILRVVRDGDLEFHHQPERRDDFRLLLWHGTKKEAIASILENGFILPKPKGQMFGPGIYFADRASKSANYGDQGFQPKAGTTAFIFLCDVLLGNVYNARKPHTKLTEAPNGLTRTFHSVKCTGKRVPDRDYNKKYHNSIICCGPTIDNKQFEEYTVNFNEFIVYKTENIRIMFLVEVEFTDKPVRKLVQELEAEENNTNVPMNYR